MQHAASVRQLKREYTDSSASRHNSSQITMAGPLIFLLPVLVAVSHGQNLHVTNGRCADGPCRSNQPSESSSACAATPTCGMFDWGVTKPYPPDCSKYVYCDSMFEAVIRDCDDGQHFSPTAYACTSPDQASCPLCGDAATTEHQLTTTEEALTTTEEALTTVVTTTLPECPPTPTCSFSEWGVNKPFPPDCTKYVYCNNLGSAVITSCSPELHFNAVSSLCSSPQSANCPLCLP